MRGHPVARRVRGASPALTTAPRQRGALAVLELALDPDNNIRLAEILEEYAGLLRNEPRCRGRSSRSARPPAQSRAVVPGSRSITTPVATQRSPDHTRPSHARTDAISVVVDRETATLLRGLPVLDMRSGFWERAAETRARLLAKRLLHTLGRHANANRTGVHRPPCTAGHARSRLPPLLGVRGAGSPVGPPAKLCYLAASSPPCDRPDRRRKLLP